MDQILRDLEENPELRTQLEMEEHRMQEQDERERKSREEKRALKEHYRQLQRAHSR